MAKNKKKKRFKIKLKNLILLIVLSLLLIVMLVLVGHKVCTKYIFNDDKEKEVEEVVKKEEIDLDNYDYYIRSNATNYEKDLFEELKNILSNETINEEEYAKVISKLFISDLFTLSNKNTSSDITSNQYVYDDYKDTFNIIVKDTIYSTIEVNLDGKRSQTLPTVKNIEVTSIEKKKFSVKDKKYDNAYYLNLNIEYETDLGYPTKYMVVLVKENDLFKVVKSKEQ